MAQGAAIFFIGRPRINNQKGQTLVLLKLIEIQILKSFLFLKSRAVRINKLRCAVEIMNYKRAQRRKFRPRLPG